MAMKKAPGPEPEKVASEIEKLKEMAPKIRQTDAFGGDNRAKIDAQIQVLEEEMDEDDIYDEWNDDEDPDSTYDIVSCARDAMEWRDGDRKESPSSEWKNLVQE